MSVTGSINDCILINLVMATQFQMASGVKSTTISVEFFDAIYIFTIVFLIVTTTHSSKPYSKAMSLQ